MCSHAERPIAKVAGQGRDGAPGPQGREGEQGPPGHEDDLRCPSRYFFVGGSKVTAVIRQQPYSVVVALGEFSLYIPLCIALQICLFRNLLGLVAL